ncbi:MAG: beta-lactamase family protein [Lentisphaeria bacterium]|nr:beta-lactamase family protein [Lentisphaeria bacterium]
MDMDLQRKAQCIVDEAVACGEEHSIQFAAFRDGECIIDVCAGKKDFEHDDKIDNHSLFPVYSTSKTVPATALNRLIYQGKINVETPVHDYWKEFAVNGKENTLLLHFLNHTSGLPQRFPEQVSYEFVADWQSMLRTIENCKPDWEPGTQTRYQSLTYGWVTAETIQRITGMSFRDYVQKELFDKAGITDFIFGLSEEDEKRTVDFTLGPGCLKSKNSISTICDPLDDLMKAPAIRKAVLPGFNGFASARGLAEFYNAVLQEMYFDRAMLVDATTSRVPEQYNADTATMFAHGYQIYGPDVNDRGQVFGHFGYGGAGGIADRKKNIAAGFTSSYIGGHKCRLELFRLAGIEMFKGYNP